MGPVQHPAGLTEAQACGSSARGRPAGQQGQEQKAMPAEPPHSTVTEGGRTLEVRWIFPGRLEPAVAGWFGRFPAGTESREDTYLLDPRLRGLSVKVRGGGELEVKVYRGSPGILEVAGRARGRLESWQKWSFPFSPPGPDRGARPGAGPAAGVRGGTHRDPHLWPGLVVPRLRGDRPRRPAPQRTAGHRRARVRPGPARGHGTRHR